MDFNESQQKIITKFKENLNQKNCKYCSKIIDGHIIIDVPEIENHFWSPQLNIEVVEADENKAIVKGLFGPKPQVWTLFMFIHFVMAFVFMVFAIMAYVQWNLKSEYSFALTMLFVVPVLWFVMYFLGRLGKKKGHSQMNELYQFMMKTLEKK
ncbi:GTP-binding protein [Lutibacter sp.]|uniref:GTP-binding protein n=1 Tax=Lutibacter sp. TaxID=1925666 RepID=UPI0025BC9830|nr:GTP-binding protein [Lutibacter sp.]MCF6181286.1 GTP-binding protein [Lutibacter sp.]